jgi:hypothetical protein
MPLNLKLIALVFGIVSLVGVFPLAGARGRAWTVPVWMFLAVPCLVCFAGSLGTLLNFGMIRRAGLQPAVGGFAALEAFLVVSALFVFALIALIVALLAPPPRAWTWRSAAGGFIAAIVSAAWCLFLGSLDADAVALTPYDTFTITVPDGFEGRVWLFEDKAAGVPPRWWLGSAYYAVPENGVLVTRDAGPMRGSKLHSTHRGVTVRDVSGMTLPHVHWAHRTTSVPSYSSERIGNYVELVFGDALPLRDLCEQANAGTFLASQLWWPNRPEVMFCPAKCRVNSTDVVWRCITTDDSQAVFDASWQAADNDAQRLYFRFTVARVPHRRAKVATMSVRNVGTETVDGWFLDFSTHFVFSLDGKYTYYNQVIGKEKQVPFVPLLPESVAHHAFFRVPGSRPLQRGEEEEFEFELARGLIDIEPTLDWANSLAPTRLP